MYTRVSVCERVLVRECVHVCVSMDRGGFVYEVLTHMVGQRLEVEVRCLPQSFSTILRPSLLLAHRAL